MADEKIAALEAAGVDVKEGLQYCRNNEKIYLRIIQKYAEEAEKKIAEIKGYYENKDFENYEIQVHGLKSSSKTMGVRDVSELAKEQEFAAKEGNITKIDEEHEKLFALYTERTQGILAALSGEAPAAGGVSGAQSGNGVVKEKLAAILKALETFEAVEAEKITDELLGSAISDASIAERLKEIKSLIGDFNMREAAKKAQELISTLG